MICRLASYPQTDGLLTNNFIPLKKYFSKNLFGNLKVTYICVTFKLHIMEKEIKQMWHFRQSPQEIWEYLTRPELMEQWLMKSDFQPIVGHKFRFTFVSKPESNYEGIVHCEVLEVKPFTKLSYTWNGRTLDKNREYNSTVVWTLIPKDNGTELLLQHNGFEVLEDILTHTNGWNTCLKRFEGHINLIQT